VKTSGGGVELELKKISQWRWSGVEVKTSGSGVEVEEEILNLGTLIDTLLHKILFLQLFKLLYNLYEKILSTNTV